MPVPKEVIRILEKSVWVDQMSSLIGAFMSNEAWYTNRMGAAYQSKFEEDATMYAEKKSALETEIRTHEEHNASLEKIAAKLQELEDMETVTPLSRFSTDGLEDLRQQLQLYIRISTQGTDFEIIYNYSHYNAATCNRTLAGIYAKNANDCYFDKKEELDPRIDLIAKAYDRISTCAYLTQKIVEGYKSGVDKSEKRKMLAGISSMASVKLITVEEQFVFVKTYIPEVKAAIASIYKMLGMMSFVIRTSKDKVSSRPDLDLDKLAVDALKQVEKISKFMAPPAPPPIAVAVTPPQVNSPRRRSIFKSRESPPPTFLRRSNSGDPRIGTDSPPIESDRNRRRSLLPLPKSPLPPTNGLIRQVKSDSAINKRVKEDKPPTQTLAVPRK